MHPDETELLLTLGQQAQIDARFWFRSLKHYIYKRTPQGELVLWVHFPFDWRVGDRRPAIIFFFGGSWQVGTVEQFTRQATYFAGRGMVAVRADYRVGSRHGATLDQCVEDAKSAVRWLRQHADELGVDPARIVASGDSAGAYLAAATAILPGFEAPEEDLAVSSRPNAQVLFNPPAGRLEGWAAVPTAELAEKLYLPPYLGPDTPPMYLWFGTADKLYPPAQEFIARAQEVGCLRELDLAEGADHGYYNDYLRWFLPSLYRADKFLASLGYLQGEPTVAPSQEAFLGAGSVGR
jgi:acetyl esterase